MPKPSQPPKSKPQIRHEMVKVLGSLEVIRVYCRRLKIAETVDNLCPMRAADDGLSHGQVIEGLIANRLSSPLPLYEIEAWARNFAVEEVFGLLPEQLNDDRLGRALEALAPVAEAVRGAVGLQAIGEFGLCATKFHWDLTSCTFAGAYAHQNGQFPIIEYGYSSNKADQDKQQVRLGVATTQDGAIPVWHEVLSGHTADVSTVVDTMNNLREQLQVSNFLLIGDSKLLSYENMFAIHRADNYFLGPLSARPELDREFLALQPETWPQLDYVSERDRKKPPEQRIRYWGTETDWQLTDPQTGKQVAFRKLFIVSERTPFVRSEERAACRKNRKRQLERALRDLEKRRSGIRSRRYYTTRERILAKVDQVLTQRKVKPFFTPLVYEVDGQLRFQLRRNERALREAEALDGYYVLCTNLPPQEADLLQAFTDYKQQAEVERRFSNVKGPLRLRPLFLKNNDRILALVTVILLALTVFCLLEREVRRKLADTDGKLAGLLPENRTARATGRNILWVLRTQMLILSTIDGQRYKERGPITGVQKRLLELLGVSLMEFG